DTCEFDAGIEREAVGIRPRVETTAHVAAADFALERLELQRLSVAFHGATERPQLDPAGKRCAQRLKADMPAPPLEETHPKRLGRLMAASADRKRDGRRKRERIDAEFAVDLARLVQAHSEMAAQPRTRGDAV